ncbi:MAG: tetratricopeptide repeat protein [Bryobacteraceae bacterium]
MLKTLAKLMIALPAAVSAVENGTLGGYVFREADGGPPRRPLTIELIDGRTQYRVETRPDGAFSFNKVREGRYTVRARFGDFVITEDVATVDSTRKNFTAVMLPKRRAGAQTFGTVTADRLAAQSDRHLQKTLRDASRMVARRDFSTAVRLYEQALDAGAQPDVRDALGLIYLYMGDRGRALQAFEKAIAQDPKYLLAYAHLGSAYLEQRRYKELASVANRALTVDSEWLTGHMYLAEAQAAAGNLHAARKSAERALQIASGRAPGPHLVLAKVQWARRDCEDARQHLERYLELNTSARTQPEVMKSLELVRACRTGP